MRDTESLVCEDIKARAAKGREKYGTTVADNPLTERQWIQHHYEELLDAAIYVRRRMQAMDANGGPVQKWRLLKPGEAIEDGDQYNWDGDWIATNRPPGRIPDNPTLYRRRVTPYLSELQSHIEELLKHE